MLPTLPISEVVDDRRTIAHHGASISATKLVRDITNRPEPTFCATPTGGLTQPAATSPALLIIAISFAVAPRPMCGDGRSRFRGQTSPIVGDPPCSACYIVSVCCGSACKLMIRNVTLFEVLFINKLPNSAVSSAATAPYAFWVLAAVAKGATFLGSCLIQITHCPCVACDDSAVSGMHSAGGGALHRPLHNAFAYFRFGWGECRPILYVRTTYEPMNY
jgi:hypothetical protein